MGNNLDALISFIQQMHETTISQSLTEYYHNVHNKRFYNDDYPCEFNKFKGMISTAKFSDKSMQFAGNFSAYYFVTPSYLKSGYGVFYQLNIDLTEKEEKDFNTEFNKYLLKQYENVNEKINKNSEKIDFDKEYNIEYFLENIVGFREKYEKWEIHNMTKVIFFDTFCTDLIEMILNDK